MTGTPGGQPREQVLSPSLTNNSENLLLEPSLGWPSMEAVMTLEVASGSKLQVGEARPPDAEQPQASLLHQVGNPTPQLLPTVEGKYWQMPRVGRLGGGIWE